MDRDKSRNRRPISHPILEITMLQNRRFIVVSIAIALALAVMTVMTVQAGIATKALADHSYDQVEQQRAARAAALADRSYDSVEALRANRSASRVSVDDSYDKIEYLRANRTWDTASSYDPHKENDAFDR